MTNLSTYKYPVPLYEINFNEKNQLAKEKLAFLDGLSSTHTQQLGHSMICLANWI